MAVSPAIQPASIGIPDTLFLMMLALVVFGPRRLPEIGRQIGKLMYEFRKVSNDFKFQMEEELRASEEADRQRRLAAIAPTPISPLPELSSAGTAARQIEASADIGAGEESASPETAPAVSGEVRAEPRRFPQIQPPASGDPVAAQKPFRGRIAEAMTYAGSAEEAPAEPAASAAPLPEPGTEQEVHHG